MKLIFGLVSTLISIEGLASELCGIVRISNHKKLVLLEDYQREFTVVRYKILNAENFDWLSSSCTCVKGQILSADDRSKGWDYQLHVENLLSIHEERDCRPAHFP